MANLIGESRGVRILALASIFGLVACGGGGPSGGEGGSGTGGKGGGAGGVVGTGGSGTGGKGGGTGGSGTGGSATGGVTGTGGAAGATTGTGGAAGASASGGAAGGTSVDGSAGSGAVDASADAGPDGGNGGACTAASQCVSGFCVDGFCCESACTGSCLACANSKTGAANGFCRPVTAGTADPKNQCTQSAASTCGTDGTCDGAGSCRKYVAGTVCSSESCSGSMDTAAGMCNGSGTCVAPNPTSCGNYVCGTTSCKTSCLSAADCATGAFCASNGTCMQPQANGATCTAGTQCSSGNCVDGVCCGSASCGTCQACSKALNGVSDGTCGPVAAGTASAACPTTTASTCGTNGMCNGAGACQFYAAGTVCAAPICTAASETAAQTCDGMGTCQPAAAPMSCGMYQCATATACLTTCATDADCTAGNFCSGGSCMPQETNGTACTAAGDCQSGNCVDGVCCNTACTGACVTCNGVGTVGTCSNAVSGTNPRSGCTATANTTCGLDGTCDGAGACHKWASGTACGVASCASSTEIPASTCDGGGNCVAGTTVPCGAYQCSASGPTCASSCSADANCNGFCSAAACFSTNTTSPVNLAGNGNLEYGTGTGWGTNGGGSLVIETGAGLVHSGTYAIADTALTANYNGPGYTLPTGAGKYNISVWAMQNQNTTQAVALQMNVSCGATPAANYPTVGSYGIALPSGVWTQITGTVDTSTLANCNPAAATPGVENSAFLYLNQTAAGTPTALPNLFLDDLVVTVTDGHNLVGNPNFEAGSTKGWQNNGGGTLQISTMYHNTGAQSLQLTARTQAYNGPRWTLPIGNAKYNVVFNALQTGSLPHDLNLVTTYACKGGSTQYGTAATAAQTTAATWYPLSATITFPPANAPAGCEMTSAGLYVQQGDSGTCGTAAGDVECPDIFVDDVSITVAP